MSRTGGIDKQTQIAASMTHADDALKREEISLGDVGCGGSYKVRTKVM